MYKRSCLFLLAFTLADGLLAADPFAQNVRPTEPLLAEDELKTFHLPPGFEIQLVASDPQISKPMNIAFDASGRLWITDTLEYPFPAKEGTKGRDSVKVLEDTDGDGRADKITTFVDGLNIPIGILPYKNGVIVYTIPNVYFFQDTDGDGKSDKQDLLYGSIGSTDTHGMTASFRRGFDGWMYATHGFSNTSNITAKDGSSIRIQSGNTYRVRVDGSHVEQWTWGQVNPFGLFFDSLGNLYSADCHSSPLYQLLRGAYYPSFGKAHDGLGFGPIMMKHSHSSTGLCGVVLYSDDKFPAEFQNNYFIGNVVTSRVNRDSIIEKGSTRLAKEEKDFLKSDDPWFRPVDLQMAPDGSLYVSDFYNKIIGHYEVDLKHPGRDRTRGRIWKIVYKGENAKPAAAPDLSKAAVPELIAAMGSSNLTQRSLATSELSDRIGATAVEPVKQAIPGGNAWQKVHGLWVLHRLGVLEPKLLIDESKNKERDVRVHVMRVLSETAALSPELREVAIAGLSDVDAHVQRAAADAIGRHGAAENINPLMKLRTSASAEDTHLVHTVRMALRNQLLVPGVLAKLPLPGWTPQDMRGIAEMALAVATPEAGAFLAAYIKDVKPGGDDRDQIAAYLPHAIRNVAVEHVDGLIAVVRERFAADSNFQIKLFKSFQESIGRRGLPISDNLREWGTALAGSILSAGEAKAPLWTNMPLETAKDKADPWFVQSRKCADGKEDLFFCSLPPGGEHLTGVLRSTPFTIPAKLSFFVAGHNGVPPQKHTEKNLIRLVEAGTHQVLTQSPAPRSDVAQPITWDLQAHAGKSAVIEIVDNDFGEAYAWIAAGRFDPSVVTVPKDMQKGNSELRLAAVEIARFLKLAQLEQPLLQSMQDKSGSADLRSAATRALLEIKPAAHIAAIRALLLNAAENEWTKEKVLLALAESNPPEGRALLDEQLQMSPQRQQAKIALALAGSAGGADVLLASVAAGKTSARVLQDKKIREKLDGAKIPAERIDKLTAGLPALDVELQKLISKRRSGFDAEKASASAGQKIFSTNCAVCHQLEGVGNLVGPQLDGAGARGIERLVEDVLDPNRNVDPAFRSSTVITNDGKIVTGLQKREEGQNLIFVDSTGKEQAIAKADVKKRQDSLLSLMPDNFGQVLPPEDFNNLMTFILSKSQKKEK